MAELPNLIKDLALILVVAGVVTLVFKRLKQPLVLGYIVAGFVVSPHMPYTMSVVDKGDIHTWADIGVTFLLFALGLEFSVKKILKMGMAPVIAAVSIIFFMLMMGMGVAGAFGWDRMDCIFLGGMVAMSSTTIIYKAFDDMGLLQQSFARLVMSVLILEDILAIVMMVMLSAIASGSNPDGGQMLGSLVRIGFFLVLWFVVGLYVVPTFLRATRKLMTDETLVIVALGLCCAMAWISTAVGFSSAFGAFVMGSILAETIEVERIEEVVAPVKNLFGAIFFVSVGMLVDPPCAGGLCRTHRCAGGGHSLGAGGAWHVQLHAQWPTAPNGYALRLLHGAGGRVCVYHRFVGTVAPCHQRLSLPGHCGGERHHHVSHTLYDKGR